MDWTYKLRNLSVVCFFFVLSYVVLDFHFYTKKKIDNIEKRVDTTIEYVQQKTDSIENETFTFLNNITALLDNRLQSIERNTFTRIDVLNTEISSLNKAVQESLIEVNQTNAESRKTLMAINEYMDCENNSFCWPNLIQDTMISVRNSAQDTNKTMLTLNESVPKLIQNTENITENFAKITKEIELATPEFTRNINNISANIDRITKPKWYDRLFGYAVNAFRIYFFVNQAGSPGGKIGTGTE